MINLLNEIPNHKKIAEQHFSQLKPWIINSIKVWILLSYFWENQISKQKLLSEISLIPLDQGTHIKTLFNIALNSKGNLRIKEIKAGNFDLNSFHQEIIKSARNIRNLLEEIDSNSEKLVTGSPIEIFSLSSDLNDQIKYQLLPKKLFVFLNSVFNYEKFSQKRGFKFNGKTPYGAYDLTKNINIDVCPFCDINFTYTVVIGARNIIRPNLDHFFSQKDHPLLQLSFYNLIPCCNTCNSSLKRDIPTSTENHSHPYNFGFEGSTEFLILPETANACFGYSNEFSIHLLPNKDLDSLSRRRIIGNKSLFALDERYNYHKNFAMDLLSKSTIMDNEYIAHINRILQSAGQNLSKEEVYSYIFGTSNFLRKKTREPLGKFRNDIISHKMNQNIS